MTSKKDIPVKKEKKDNVKNEHVVAVIPEVKRPRGRPPKKKDAVSPASEPVVSAPTPVVDKSDSIIDVKIESPPNPVVLSIPPINEKPFIEEEKKESVEQPKKKKVNVGLVAVCAIVAGVSLIVIIRYLLAMKEAKKIEKEISG